MSSPLNNALQDAIRLYQYTALPSAQSIRLVELKADVDSIWSDIAISLKVINLHEAPEYDALSYTWGYPLTPYSDGDQPKWGMDAVRRYPIDIDGHPLEVTANLVDALHALADADIKTAARKSHYLWIDSICINQDDQLERAAQVVIMSSIYGSAQNVIIWLGREDEFTKDALAAINALSKIPRQRHSEVKLSDWYNQGEVLRRLGVLQEITPHRWLGLVAFLNRPWFRRAWIVQEVILARDAVIVCGRNILPWSMLSDTIAFLTSTTWHDQISTDQMRAINSVVRNPGPYGKLLDAHVNVGMAAIYLESTRAGIASAGHKAVFRYLIEAHRFCEASDPRDMIYAFLGLAWKERLPFSTNPEAINPDYQISVRKLYTYVAKTMLQSYKDLRFLSHVQDHALSKIDNLASWVPDYSVELRPAPLSRRVTPWRACGTLFWNHESGYQEPGLLNVSGLCLDTIVDTVTESPSPHDFRESAATDEYWMNVFKLTQELNDLYPGQRSQSRIEVLWRTLLANTYSNQHPAPNVCGTKFFELINRALARIFAFEEITPGHTLPDSGQERRWEKMIRAWQTLIELEPEGSPFSSEEFEDQFSTAIEKESPTEHVPSYRDLFTDLERDLRYTGNMRRLFRTPQGYLGIGAQSLQVNDEVWILGGADTPMVLRKKSNRSYRLIGETYVHGVMYGEAVKSIVQERMQGIILE